MAVDRDPGTDVDVVAGAGAVAAAAAEWTPRIAVPPPVPAPAPPRPPEWMTSWAHWPHPCLDLRPAGPWADDGALYLADTRSAAPFEIRIQIDGKGKSEWGRIIMVGV